MRGFFILSLVCLVVYTNHATAQWPKYVLSKGKTCEDLCKSRVKMCKPQDEFKNCKCFPQRLVTSYLKYNKLPIDPRPVCLYMTGMIDVVPNCCASYIKQKDSDKNSESEMASTIHDQGQEIEQLKNKLVSCGQDESVQSSNLTNNQNDEIENLHKRLDTEQGLTAEMFKQFNKSIDSLTAKMNEQNIKQVHEIEQLKQRLASEQVNGARLSNLTLDMSHTLDAQNKDLETLTAAWSSEPWKKLAKSGSGVAFFYYLYYDMNVRGNYNPREVIKFSARITDIGGGYNTATGVFTCPEAGTYLFTYTLYVTSHQVALLNVSGQKHLVLGTTKDSTKSEQATISGVYKLKKGDTVYVEPRVAGTVGKYSEFSGIRVPT